MICYKWQLWILLLPNQARCICWQHDTLEYQRKVGDSTSSSQDPWSGSTLYRLFTSKKTVVCFQTDNSYKKPFHHEINMLFCHPPCPPPKKYQSWTVSAYPRRIRLLKTLWYRQSTPTFFQIPASQHFWLSFPSFSTIHHHNHGSSCLPNGREPIPNSFKY